MELCPGCPAALALDGPPVAGPSVLCSVMVNEAPRVDTIAGWDVEGQLLTAAEDGSTIASFCLSPAMPSLTEEPHRPTAHYTSCPVWRAEKERIWAARDLVAPNVQPEAPLNTINPGAEQYRAGDPREKLMQALEELAPAA